MGDYGVGTQNPFNLLDDDDNEPQAQEHEEARGGKAPKAHSKTATKTGQQEVASRKKETAPAESAKPRKREFDRHSGTGRGKEVQKGGKGKFNWGSNEEPADAGAEVAAPVEAVAEAEVAAPVEPEKEDLGYEDYLAQLAQKRPEDDLKVQVREAIVDNKQFKAGKALEAQEEEPLFAELVQQKSKAKKEKKAKAAVSLDEFVAKNGGPIVREHRDFGEGGRGRGGRGRGGFRGGRGRGGFGGAPSDGAAAPAPVDGAAPAPADGAAPAQGDQGFRGGRGGRGRGGFRGGRGGERGGFRGESRGRGGFRGGRGGRGGQGGNQGQPIDVSDDSLFPALKKQ